MPSQAIQKLRFEIDEWKAQNPLLLWREREHLTRATLVAMVGLGYVQLREYEKGRANPSTRSFVTIARLMERKPETLKTEWDAWMAKRPRQTKDRIKDGE